MRNLGLFLLIISINSLAAVSTSTSQKPSQKPKDNVTAQKPKENAAVQKPKEKVIANTKNNTTKNNSVEIQSTDAKIGEFPYQVSLRYKSTKAHYCGGVILNESFILTAAQCIYDISLFKSQKKEDLFMVAGQIEKKLNDDSVTREIKNITRHPYFKPYRLRHDLAILELTIKLPPFNTTKSIQPIKLNDKAIPEYLNCSVTGWGEVSGAFKKKKRRRTTSESLRIDYITAWSRQACKTTRANLMVHHLLPKGTFCSEARSKAKKLTKVCRLADDPGGPMICNKMLTGLVAIAADCAMKERPAIYTDIHNHLPWIKYQRVPPTDFSDDDMQNSVRSSRRKKKKSGSVSKLFCNYLFLLIVIIIKF